MKGIAFLENIDMMVLSSIIAVVILAFMLVVIIFAVKFKTQHEQNRQLKEHIEEKTERIALLEESLNKVRILNASLQQELGQQEELRAKLQEEIDALTMKLQSADDKTEELAKQILSLEKDKSELGATLTHTKESLLKLEEALAQATKRNEFWVEQMTEVRTKYDALKLKMK
jgi:chromosome segregation ATPase